MPRLTNKWKPRTLSGSSSNLDSPNSESRLSISKPQSVLMPTIKNSVARASLLSNVDSIREIFKRNNSSFESDDLDDIAWRTFSELMMEKELEGVDVGSARLPLSTQLVFRYAPQNKTPPLLPFIAVSKNE